MKKSLYIFDVDGTIVDAYPAITDSMNFTRTALGYSKVSSAKVKKCIGHGDEHFIGQFFKKDDFEIGLEIFREHHKLTLVKMAKPMPGAIKVLSHLKKQGKILAVASNRPKYYTDMLLNKLKLNKFFKVVYCGDQLKSLKPHPKMLTTIINRYKVKKQEAVYIGDMDIDLETAKRAGIDAVFTTTGSSSLKDVLRYKNKKVISHLEKLLHLYC